MLANVRVWRSRGPGERHAQDWIAWSRAPDHDGFWAGTWPVLESVLPPPGGVTLDLGCGEGRSSRELARLGHRVVGVDRSPTLVRAAAAAAPGVPVVLADAGALPLPDASVDLVVACMCLHDIDDLGGAVREVGRVLRDDGQLCIAMVHPFVTAQDEDTLHSDVARVSGSYLQPRRYEDHVEREELAMTFVSMHRPLSAYTAELSRNAMVIDELIEWGSRSVPWLLVLRASATSRRRQM